jgi:hypothetical protein
MLNNDTNTSNHLCTGIDMLCDLTCSKCDQDLAYYLNRNIKTGLDVPRFIDHMKDHGFGPVGTCVICGKNYVYGGNNPSPVVKDEGARCCFACHDEVVIPTRTESVYSVKGGFGKGIKRKWAGSPNLSPLGIVQYVRDAGIVKVRPAGKTRETQNGSSYYITDAEYNAPFIIFKRSDTDEVVTIDAQKILRSQLTRGDIRIELSGEWGDWLLYANYDEGSDIRFRRNVNEPLNPHEVKFCLLRAAHLEANLNNALDIKEGSDVRVYARFRTGQMSDKDQLTYYHRFEVMVGNTDNHIPMIYADGMYHLSEGDSLYPKMEMKDLTRGLMRHLLPVDQRDNLNF